MNVVYTQGVVLRYTNTGESDRMLTIFSPNLGKLSVLARGCRKSKSRFLAATQLFSYGEYAIMKYRDIYILSQCEIKNAYFDIRCDIERLAYATYLLNLTEEVVNVGEGNYRLFALLLQGLTYLSYSEIGPEDIMLLFEIKLMDVMGYSPQLDHCLHCGDKPNAVIKFSMVQGGIICTGCTIGDYSAHEIDLGTIETISDILTMDLSRLSVLKFNPKVREQLNSIVPEFIFEKLEKRIKSRDYIQSLRLNHIND